MGTKKLKINKNMRSSFFGNSVKKTTTETYNSKSCFFKEIQTTAEESCDKNVQEKYEQTARERGGNCAKTESTLNANKLLLSSERKKVKQQRKG